MRRIIYIAALLAIAGYAAAQDIRITRFERCFTCIGASIDPVYDNTGKACALIRFAVRDTSMQIEPNLGYMKRESQIGEIRLYVPAATRRLSLRAIGLKLLRDYEIPVKLEQMATYDADVETAIISNLPQSEEDKEEENPEPIISEKMEDEPRSEVYTEPEERLKVTKVKSRTSNTHFIYGLGWNVLPLNGPELCLGIDTHHHIIELGGVYGLKKTDALYYYTSNYTSESPQVGWKYSAIRGNLGYGYDIFHKSTVSMVPMFGVMASKYYGKKVFFINTNTNQYKNASSVSAFAALRFTLSLGKRLKFHVTPRYDFSVYKSDNCKLICDNDDTLKNWTNGFNLSVGFIIK